MSYWCDSALSAQKYGFPGKCERNSKYGAIAIHIFERTLVYDVPTDLRLNISEEIL